MNTLRVSSIACDRRLELRSIAEPLRLDSISCGIIKIRRGGCFHRSDHVH